MRAIKRAVLDDERHRARFVFVEANLERCLDLIGEKLEAYQGYLDRSQICAWIAIINEKYFVGWHPFEVIIELSRRFRDYPKLHVFMRRAERTNGR